MLGGVSLSTRWPDQSQEKLRTNLPNFVSHFPYKGWWSIMMLQNSYLSCTLSCYLRSQNLTLVHTRSYRWYEERLINKGTNLSLSQLMDSAVLIFNDIQMSLNLLNHRFVCLSQEADAWLEGLHRPIINQKLDIPTDDHGPSSSNTNFRLWSATYPVAHSGPLPFLKTLFRANPRPPISMAGVLANPLHLSISLDLY